MPTYTYLRWYSTPTWSSFVFCMLFFRCWVPDFLFYIILALLLPRFLCFFLFVCSFVKVVKLLPLKPVASSSFWTLEKYPESQIPAKERWSSSIILSIWLPRSENVFRWVIWLPSPSMLTCRLPRKDPGRRTASNCSFLSQKNLVTSPNHTGFFKRSKSCRQKRRFLTFCGFAQSMTKSFDPTKNQKT